jgi:short-subunit dehydrogenase
VNCAGISSYGETSEIPRAEWDRVIDVNLRGTIDVSLAAFASMREGGGGSIVNVASVSAFLNPPLFGPYITSKAAVIGFSRALAVEAEAHGVLVSVVCPGNVRTPMLGAWKQSFLTPSISPEDAATRILKGVAKRRTMIVFPFYAKVFWYLDRLSPGLLDPARRAILRRARARKSAESRKAPGGET